MRTGPCAILPQAIHVMLPDISPANTAYLTGVAAAFSSYPNGFKVCARLSLTPESSLCHSVGNPDLGPQAVPCQEVVISRTVQSNTWRSMLSGSLHSTLALHVARARVSQVTSDLSWDRHTPDATEASDL